MTEPTPRIRTVDEVAGPYANFLVPLPRAGTGVCSVCHGAVYDGYSTCYPCKQAQWELRRLVADAVSFVALAPVGEQMARDLYTYKRDSVPADLRRPRLIGLAAVLWKWLAVHEPCVANASDVARFDVVTSVPSTSGRTAKHPLAELVSGIVDGTRDRYEELLTVRRTDLGQRDQAADRYAATRDLACTSVLVVDDTWTTGAHAQSASAALKAAGAAAVGVVVLGRWFDPNFRENKQWLADHRERWAWDSCALHT